MELTSLAPIRRFKVLTAGLSPKGARVYRDSFVVCCPDQISRSAQLIKRIRFVHRQTLRHGLKLQVFHHRGELWVAQSFKTVPTLAGFPDASAVKLKDIVISLEFSIVPRERIRKSVLRSENRLVSRKVQIPQARSHGHGS
ncbi:MAG: hypothetical protein C5S49_05045 [Candidatus Methanogaster sp.]|nr:MAG: hypothetical protein C5S49_05045 [ANME-2 cluster archaeon]